MGIKCSDSQLLLLEVGGLVSKTKGKWKATIPILDKEQTNSLRSLSKEIAESMYVKTKADFISLAQTISEMGFKNNVLSLVFSYLLDGKMPGIQSKSEETLTHGLRGFYADLHGLG
jgi:hypothetical protein